MTDQTRGGNEARLGVVSDDLVLPKRDAVDVVREWLDIARKEPIRACQVLRYPPICGSEIDAIDTILSRQASQEETTRADGEVMKPFAEAADSLDDDHKDGSSIWESAAAMGIDAGDLRKARARLAARQEGGEG